MGTEGDIPVTAGPPRWVQDCMFLTTWAIEAQVFLVVVIGSIYPLKMDADGNVEVAKDAPGGLVKFVTFMRFFSLVFMYGSTMYVVNGLTGMTPERVQPYEVVPLFPSIGPMPAPPYPNPARFGGPD